MKYSRILYGLSFKRQGLAVNMKYKGQLHTLETYIKKHKLKAGPEVGLYDFNHNNNIKTINTQLPRSDDWEMK